MPAAIAGCIWACAPDQLHTYADRLESIFDITLPTVDSGGLAMRSSGDSGIHLIAPGRHVEPGVWGVVVDVDDLPAARRRFPAVPHDVSVQPAHNSLEQHGLVFAGPVFGANVYLRDASGSAALDLRRRPASLVPYPYLFVWVVSAEDLDRYAAELTARFDADFEQVGISGACAAVAWDSGFELIAPEPRELHPVDGRLDETTTDPHFDHLRTHGSGPWSIVLRVVDIDAFRERSARLGHQPGPPLQDADPARRRSWYRSWTRKVIEQREVRLPALLGLRLMAGEVTYVIDEK